jgi:hypothetical protein
MAHWAEIDNDSTVLRVLVTDNNDPNGDEGYQFLTETFGGNWVKTSFNTSRGLHLYGGTPFRKNYAGIGFTYDPIRDAFIPPRPDGFISWIVDEETCTWKTPIDMPSDGNHYEWDEDSVSWIEVEEEPTE